MYLSGIRGQPDESPPITLRWREPEAAGPDGWSPPCSGMPTCNARALHLFLRAVEARLACEPSGASATAGSKPPSCTKEEREAPAPLIATRHYSTLQRHADELQIMIDLRSRQTQAPGPGAHGHIMAPTTRLQHYKGTDTPRRITVTT